MTVNIRARALCAAFTTTTFAAVILIGGWAGSAQAEDRPTEIQFDQPERIPTLRADELRGPIRRIVINDHSLIPREIVLDYGERFGWESQSRAASRIVFEREVARTLFCRSLVNFSIADDELRSSELQVNDVANFCQLEPGRYPYRVIRSDPSTGASRRLDGWVTVRGKSDSRSTSKVARSAAP